MIAIKTIDLRDDFKRISDIVGSGEKVIISRPHNKNLILLTEKEYNEMDKARRNAEYLAKVDAAETEIAMGKVVVKTLDELEEMAKQ